MMKHRGLMKCSGLLIMGVALLTAPPAHAFFDKLKKGLEDATKQIEKDLQNVNQNKPQKPQKNVPSVGKGSQCPGSPTTDISVARKWTDCSGTLVQDRRGKVVTSSLSGQFKNGDLNGQCSITNSKTGFKYVGTCKDSKRHGQGTESGLGRYKYVGKFADNRWNGQGTLENYSDSTKHVGTFKDSVLREGTITHTRTGKVQKGLFDKDGKYLGTVAQINARKQKEKQLTQKTGFNTEQRELIKNAVAKYYANYRLVKAMCLEKGASSYKTEVKKLFGVLKKAKNQGEFKEISPKTKWSKITDYAWEQSTALHKKNMEEMGTVIAMYDMMDDRKRIQTCRAKILPDQLRMIRLLRRQLEKKLRQKNASPANEKKAF